ncbi:MAG: type II toxin-antitoxin system death-on-curing family toxin [Candidatus Gracilibacteria bacterium]|jgi:death-on-curing family protein
MAKVLTIKEVEISAHEMAKFMMSWNEPIPDFNSRFPGVLESCLNTPFQTFNKNALYRGLVSQAAILFYLLIKNHPFQNGNKRIAVTCLFIFLDKNKKWIKTSSEELYNFAVWIAQSSPKLKVYVIEAIKNFIRKNIVNL